MSYSYTYPNFHLWDDATWAEREAAIQPLVSKLSRYLYDHVRPTAALKLYEGRTDGYFHPKIKARIYPDVIAQWENKGLKCHITGMGFVSWIALLPEKLQADTPVVLRYHSMDMSDPNWAMDALAYYAQHGEKAAKNGFALVIMVQSGPFGAGIYTDILMEVSALWQLDLKPLYMDLTGLDEGEFPGGEDFCGLRVTDITDRWQSFVAHQYIVSNLNRRNPEFDVERLIHSPLGRRMAEGMRLEHDFRRWDEPELLQRMEEKGVKLEGHWCQGERYLTAAPMDSKEKLLQIYRPTPALGKDRRCLAVVYGPGQYLPDGRWSLAAASSVWRRPASSCAPA